MWQISEQEKFSDIIAFLYDNDLCLSVNVFAGFAKKDITVD